MFVQSFATICQSEAYGTLKFEKDDDDCIRFVTATSNMRTFNFTHKYKEKPKSQTKDKFEYLTEYKVKVIGGKVVPAIASTNSIAAAV